MRISSVLLCGLGLVCHSWATTNATSACKCLPTDSCWPSTSEWDALNTTIGGRLIATTPLAISCHQPNFDNATCSALQDQWRLPGVHMADPSSIMAPFFANQSCDPFTSEPTACQYGNYVRYAVNVSTPEDIGAALDFAKKKNIRFVVRNTGHDYNGRSTGAGALSVWTHHLKSIQILDWTDPDASYTSKAVRVGAGVQGFEILSALRNESLIAVTGECPTVGIAGGYSQGGGHSPLSTVFGLGADQVLEWEVVLVDGTLVTASAAQNSNLYWALSGGGAGTYGVVVAITVKVHPDAQIGSASLAFSPENTTTSTFFAAVNAFHTALPSIIDSGAMVVYNFSTTVCEGTVNVNLRALQANCVYIQQYFRMNSLTAYNKSADDVKATLRPYLTVLDALNISYTLSYRTDATYYDHYNHYLGPVPIGRVEVGIGQYASRLIPRSLFQSNSSTRTLADTARFITEQGVMWVGIALDVSRGAAPDHNAVIPAWRDALVHAVFTTTWSFDPADWDRMLDDQRLLTDKIMPAIEAVTPGSGAYMNEGDFQQPSFQEAFYGNNYDTLQAIKDKYDPEGILYVAKGVGSQRWAVSEDGRMCRSGAG